MRTMLKSKIHRARVTEANINYEGSITIDRALMEAADIVAYEQVAVLDVDTGARLQTYAVEGARGSGTVVMNGAAARLIHKGDIIIILTYEPMDDKRARNHHPKLVYVNDRNAIMEVKGKAAKAVVYS